MVPDDNQNVPDNSASPFEHDFAEHQTGGGCGGLQRRALFEPAVSTSFWSLAKKDSPHLMQSLYPYPKGGISM